MLFMLFRFRHAFFAAADDADGCHALRRRHFTLIR